MYFSSDLKTTSHCSHIARGSTARVSAAHHVYEGHLNATPGARFSIVIGRFNDLVTKLLLEGALGTFQRHGVAAEDIDVSDISLAAAAVLPQSKLMYTL
jgi:6,7-dimethyl-8-ribityllumazine synthase